LEQTERKCSGVLLKSYAQYFFCSFKIAYELKKIKQKTSYSVEEKMTKFQPRQDKGADQQTRTQIV
jgi:hypothetical protein